MPQPSTSSASPVSNDSAATRASQRHSPGELVAEERLSDESARRLAAEEQYRRVVEAAHEGICTVDVEGRITYANARLAALLQCESDQLVGRMLFDFMLPQAAFEARTRFARHQRGIAEVIEVELRRSDGSMLPVLKSVSSLFDPDGTFRGAVYLLMDVTERHAAQRRLAESEECYRSLFDRNPDAVYSLDTDGTFLSVNAACERLTGYPRAELVGKPFARHVLPEHLEPVMQHYGNAAAGIAASYETAVRHASGRRIDVAITNVPIIVGGKVVGVFGIAKDLTGQRELEAQLRQASKMEAIGRLAGGVAHDFNNILTVITSYTELALSGVGAETARTDLREVAAAAGRAASLTRQLLAFGRQQLLQPRRLDLNHAVNDVTGMLRRVLGEDVTLETRLDSQLWPAFVDPGQIEQVLMNLAVNARDAMPRGGILRISTSNTVVDEASARLRQGLAAGEYATLIVEDTGTGIDATMLQRIFEPFVTTKEPGHGTGLGLATVYGIVKQSGGYIYVDSAVGLGSCFTIFLPRTEQADPAPVALTPARLPRGTERILLVEDEDGVRAAARRMLELLGYTIIEAAGARAALRELEAAERRGERVDLVLTDVVMPEMGGRALGDRLALLHPEMSVLYMSGYTNDEILRRGLMQPGAPFLAKPFSVTTLATAVRRSLDLAGSTSHP